MFGALQNKGPQQQQQQGSGLCENAMAFVDLEPVFDKTKISCLNFAPHFPVDSCLFDKGNNLFLKSDADQQLIITIGFDQAVRIHHIELKARNDDSAPTLVKIFANSLPKDFQTAENDTPTQTLELSADDLLNDINLKYVKFQNVNTITFFIEENGGADETIINSLRVYGSTVAAANMKNLKKVG